MKDLNLGAAGYFHSDACDLSEFVALIDQEVLADDIPQATDVQSNVPIYDMTTLRPSLDDPKARRALMTEWAWVMLDGSGAIALTDAYADTTSIDEATTIYEDIIREEKATRGDQADHFAAGSNDRVWNSLQKLGDRDPDVFLRYFANTAIAAVCEAWLGPNYQMTAQVNLVHPGGPAQQAHRDYHMGFMTAEIASEYPAHVHALSPIMTLQGAVAHCDMPVESGPTKLLPFSQAYLPGYTAWRREDFREAFEARSVQIPLKKGDAVFFNPAIFHAAGANSTSDIHRIANLLQVSSAFGRATEAVDRRAMSKRLYPAAQAAHSTGTLTGTELAAAIACAAEGYSFPTNLDSDPPKGGLAPETQAAGFHRALDEGLSADSFAALLDAMAARQRA